MRTKLLLSTAAVALMLAVPAAFAQSNSDKKPEAAKEQTQAKPAQQDKAAEHKAQDNKAASDKSQANKGAAQAQQPKQQQSATERPQHERQNSENKAAQQNAKERNTKEQNAQKQSPERSAKDANTPTNKAAGTNKRSTTGQSTRDEQKPGSQPQQTQSPAAQQNKTNAAPQSTTGGNAPNVSGSNTNATNTPNAAGTNAAQRNTATVNAQQLPPDQRVKISETISHTRDLAPPVRDLRVSINVGTRVPERVHLRRLPSEIVTIVPAYREYDYFTTEEDVVIVNPRTRDVVTMIPRDASRARAEVGSSSTQVSSMSGGMSGAMSGPPPCQVLRREASGQTVPVDPQDLSRSTTGSGSSDRNQLAVTVQAPNGQSMPPIALPEQTGQIVVATDGGDCKITIEPGAH